MPLVDDYVRSSGPGRESGWGESGDAFSYFARSTGTGSRYGDLFGEEASVASMVPRSTAAAAYMPTPAALGRLRSKDDQAAATVSSSARLPASMHCCSCAYIGGACERVQMLYSEREVAAMLQNGLSLIETKVLFPHIALQFSKYLTVYV